MADLITPVILLTFGGGIAVIVAGFYILMRRNRNSPFRSNYANYAPRPNSPKYNSRSPFRKDEDRLRRAGANKRAMFAIILVLFLVIAAVASTLSNSIDLLLFLILLSPFLLSLLRVRRRERDEERNPDGDRRSSN